MKTFLTLIAALGITLGAADIAVAKSANSADGKAIGSTGKGDKGRSANAPGKTGATGKGAAPGQDKGGE